VADDEEDWKAQKLGEAWCCMSGLEISDEGDGLKILSDGQLTSGSVVVCWMDGDSKPSP